MDDLPNFTHLGYIVERELGANRSGGRVTYLATDRDRDCQVVIKQFQFAKSVSNWSAYDAHQREIEVLRDLHHSGIPRYLDSFQVADGFCMVQEYKAARPLSVNRSFKAEDIKVIAVKILEILIYLQNRIPAIIHRDLKPDNILVDDHLNVFLVDFGFAHVGEGEVGVSSVVKGTLGFMPPEQLFNRQLTEASDLYGLGMTLICLLTQTKPDNIGALVDISYQIKFKHLVPKLSLPWVKWLEKMVEPRVKERYPNAKAALKALPSWPVYPPELQLGQAEIELVADHADQILSYPLEITNGGSDVMLTGTWEIKLHPQDRGSTRESHAWITIAPQQFEGKQIECVIQVDTSQLMTGTEYARTLLLHTNAFPKTYTVPLHVRTASLPIQTTQQSFYPLVLLFSFVLLAFRILVGSALPPGLGTEVVQIVSFGWLLGALVGLQMAAWTLQSTRSLIGAQLTSWATVLLALPTLVSLWFFLESLAGAWDRVLSGFIPGTLGGWLLGMGMGLTVDKLFEKAVPRLEAIALIVLTSLMAIVLALGLVTAFSQPLLTLTATLLAIAIGSMLLIAPLKHAQRVAAYRRLERHRIRPK